MLFRIAIFESPAACLSYNSPQNQAQLLDISMDIEYNEARVKDVEIVLFQFEQRVEKLEQQLLHD